MGAVFWNQIETVYINPDNYSPNMAYSPQTPNQK
jgi:hypothetical protein